MKSFAVFAIALACVAADVYKYDSEAPIVKSQYEISPERGYQYIYETGNGISAQELGIVKNLDTEHPSIVVSGTLKYTSPDGTPIELTYEADEDGFKPVGSHLPVPPAIPKYIVRSLNYIAAHPPKPIL